jgi:hypothetical protein
MPKGRATPSTTSQPVALLGEAPPRVLVAPQQTRANSWQDVADLSAQFGIVLDEWQELVLQAAMGERANATWAAKRVGLSVPRQNGKSQLLVARILAGALLFGERKIVVSAHQQDTARESFTKLLEIVEADGNGALRARIKPNGIMQALNREAVKFTNGAVIQFKARSGPGGRGFSSDCLMLDEAQILSQRAWVSINSTMSAMPNPQVWLMGTPPTPEDDGEVFGNVRASAMSGKSSSVAWLEWAADPAADPNEELTRWAANPGWNVRINHEVVDGEARLTRRNASRLTASASGRLRTRRSGSSPPTHGLRWRPRMSRHSMHRRARWPWTLPMTAPSPSPAAGCQRPRRTRSSCRSACPRRPQSSGS